MAGLRPREGFYKVLPGSPCFVAYLEQLVDVVGGDVSQSGRHLLRFDHNLSTNVGHHAGGRRTDEQAERDERRSAKNSLPCTPSATSQFPIPIPSATHSSPARSLRVRKLCLVQDAQDAPPYTTTTAPNRKLTAGQGLGLVSLRKYRSTLAVHVATPFPTSALPVDLHNKTCMVAEHAKWT